MQPLVTHYMVCHLLEDLNKFELDLGSNPVQVVCHFIFCKMLEHPK